MTPENVWCIAFRRHHALGWRASTEVPVVPVAEEEPPPRAALSTIPGCRERLQAKSDFVRAIRSSFSHHRTRAYVASGGGENEQNCQGGRTKPFENSGKHGMDASDHRTDQQCRQVLSTEEFRAPLRRLHCRGRLTSGVAPWRESQ